MKKLIGFGLSLFIASLNGMQQTQYTINAPYFDGRKQEYVIEAVNKINKPVGILKYLNNSGREWEMLKLEVASTCRQQGVARALLAACISNVKAAGGSQLSWKALPKEDNLSEEQLIALYYRMLAKIDPLYVAKTSLEYRGDDNLQSPWLILNLE